jgi:hypothetical protein
LLKFWRVASFYLWSEFSQRYFFVVFQQKRSDLVWYHMDIWKQTHELMYQFFFLM